MDQDGAIRVLLADDRSLFREALRTVLDSEQRLCVVGEAGEDRSAMVLAERTQPDVAMVSASLPKAGGVEVTRRLSETLPACRVVVLTDEEDPNLLVAALEAGASGYLTKDCPLADFIASAHTVSKGEMVIPPRMLGGLLARLIRQRRERDGALRLLARLTPREREVLLLLTEGVNNDGIAQALVISPETARTHVQNLLSKLGVHSRLQAAAFVVQHGLLEELAGVRP